MNRTRRSVAVALSVFALDNLCISVVLPIFTILVLSPASAIFSTTLSLSNRYVYLGWLIAAFPLAMVLGAIVIGFLADLRGRRTAFITTLVGELLGTICTLMGFYRNSFAFLIIGRAISGFFAGNITICLATLADVSPPGEKRSSYFGILGSVSGLTFVAGILLGGILSNQYLSSSFTPALVFWIIFGFTLLNIALIVLLFDETLKKQPVLHSPFHLRSVFAHYFVYFFAIIGWFTLVQFLNADIFVRFNGTKITMTWMLVATGVIFALGTGVIGRKLCQKCPRHTLILSALTITIVCLVGAGFVSQFLLFSLFYFIAVIGVSCVWIGLLSLISSTANQCSQGKIVSANQAILAVSMAISPLLGGAIASTFTIRGVYFSGAIFTCVAFLLYLVFVKRK